jgi:hypothetical protein
LPQNAHYQKWIWPVYKLGPVIGLVMSLIPLFVLKYPDSLKARVEADLAERRKARALADDGEDGEPPLRMAEREARLGHQQKKEQ